MRWFAFPHRCECSARNDKNCSWWEKKGQQYTIHGCHIKKNHNGLTKVPFRLSASGSSEFLYIKKNYEKTKAVIELTNNFQEFFFYMEKYQKTQKFLVKRIIRPKVEFVCDSLQRACNPTAHHMTTNIKRKKSVILLFNFFFTNSAFLWTNLKRMNTIIWRK